jgi:patatin-like phospholipase/acyl hydrolase
LAEFEERYLDGASVLDQFDLITGTSTGGIIALGLSIGIPARELAKLYIERGMEIFPPASDSRWGRLKQRWEEVRSLARFRYNRDALSALLVEAFGQRRFGEAKVPLCIPSCDGNFGDVYIFKTPHHPDFKKDQHELMTTVACATSAAPTFFQPLDSGGFRFVDGGLWANNPIMVGLVDALSCFDVDRHQIRILSLGCGDEPYKVGGRMVSMGGQFFWRSAVMGSMGFQSLNALGQAKLLVGAERVLRIAPAMVSPPIQLDDWRRAASLLPQQGADAARSIAAAFPRRPPS